ncbi:hypothetical protein BCUN_1803 [Bifidobacterium cuniculi]|uniref:Uncharacterized protein n=1 Tax=Bifidobacterium cuniculi TaxID=1688 RepID=A0A087AT61_9BIFI|nr:hypothetical protein BCUN_1803 [Bifidobacterium cuniculi]
MNCPFVHCSDVSMPPASASVRRRRGGRLCQPTTTGIAVWLLSHGNSRSRTTGCPLCAYRTFVKPWERHLQSLSHVGRRHIPRGEDHLWPAPIRMTVRPKAHRRRHSLRKDMSRDTSRSRNKGMCSRDTCLPASTPNSRSRQPRPMDRLHNSTVSLWLPRQGMRRPSSPLPHTGSNKGQSRSTGIRAACTGRYGAGHVAIRLSARCGCWAAPHAGQPQQEDTPLRP